MGYGPKGIGCCGQVGGKGMIIPEFLIPGGGTGKRYEINSLLSPPFFFCFFDVISLYCPKTLLFLSVAPILTKGLGMPPRGEVAVYKGGKGE